MTRSSRFSLSMFAYWKQPNIVDSKDLGTKLHAVVIFEKILKITVFLRLDATATIFLCTYMQIISDYDHWASARAACVVQLVSTADSRTERLPNY